MLTHFNVVFFNLHFIFPFLSARYTLSSAANQTAGRMVLAVGGRRNFPRLGDEGITLFLIVFAGFTLCKCVRLSGADGDEEFHVSFKL